MSKLYSHIGARVGNVVAIGKAPGWQMLCMCDCGLQCLVQGQTFIRSMRESRGLSCGCMKKRLISVGNTVHGMTNSPTMRSWNSMIERCYSPDHKSFKDYGARGINVCDEWRASFSQFFADMGSRPAGTTLGRIDNDSGYAPWNCEWQTHKCQSNNRRSNRKIEFNGECKNLGEWAEALAIPSDTLAFRLRSWTISEAFFRPLKMQKNSRSLKASA